MSSKKTKIQTLIEQKRGIKNNSQMSIKSKANNNKNFRKGKKNKQTPWEQTKKSIGKILLDSGKVFGKYLAMNMWQLIFAQRKLKIKELHDLILCDHMKKNPSISEKEIQNLLKNNEMYQEAVRKINMEAREEITQRIGVNTIPIVTLTTNFTLITSAAQIIDDVINVSWTSFMHSTEFMQLFNRVAVVGKMTFIYYPNRVVNTAVNTPIGTGINAEPNAQFPTMWVICDKDGDMTPLSSTADVLDYADKDLFDVCRGKKKSESMSVNIDNIYPDLQFWPITTNFNLPYTFKTYGTAITGIPPPAASNWGCWRVVCNFAFEGELAADDEEEDENNNKSTKNNNIKKH